MKEEIKAKEPQASLLMLAVCLATSYLCPRPLLRQDRILTVWAPRPAMKPALCSFLTRLCPHTSAVFYLRAH